MSGWDLAGWEDVGWRESGARRSPATGGAIGGDSGAVSDKGVPKYNLGTREKEGMRVPRGRFAPGMRRS
jgi:hypothetical protein